MGIFCLINRSAGIFIRNRTKRSGIKETRSGVEETRSRVEEMRSGVKEMRSGGIFVHPVSDKIRRCNL
ncbi:MAG: hypothetical protein GDA51_02345 [Ekhidna sp.]|nr:hypothetical protein [Ekhidna sp.]